MKENIFKSTSNMSAKQIKAQKSEYKKAVNSALAEYSTAIDGAFAQVIKSTDKKSRDVANAAKGMYKTAIDVIAACYPYQTADGTLCAKKAVRDENDKITGHEWAAKKLTAAAARSIVREALKNFINSCGSPSVTIVVVGAAV